MVKNHFAIRQRRGIFNIAAMMGFASLQTDKGNLSPFRNPPMRNNNVHLPYSTETERQQALEESLTKGNRPKKANRRTGKMFD